jgi:hypothetical protein
VQRNVQDKLREIRSRADYPSWGSRSFGAGTNVLGGAGFVGVENIAFGGDILNVNTTGFANVGVGLDILSANTTGAYNYGFGIKCLLRNTIGISNSAFGTFTLYNNTTGNSNVAMGEDGQRYADTGSFNVTVGVQALYNNGTGSNNTAVGTYAARGFNNPGDTDPAIGPSPTQLCAFGFNAVYGAAGTYNHGFGVETLYNVTGSFNTAVGGLAGRAITSGANNVFVGYNTGNTSQTATASGAVAVGKDARTTGDNATALGIATVAAANAVALGQSATAAGNAGIAIGAGASAAGNNAIAIGQNASAPTANQVVIGNSSNTGNFFFGGLQPQLDNVAPVGGGASRWSTIFAGTGTINTSDEREKEQFRSVAEAERRVALVIKSGIRAFKFRDAVATKGEGARWHFGVGAQTVAAAFVAEGLDPTDYALFCFDEWDAQPEVLDADGNVFKPAMPAGNRYGIRYDELAMFILAAV